MLTDAFGGTKPLLRTYSNVMAAIADGPLVAQLNGAPPPGDTVDTIADVGLPTPKPATDDWPFLYLRTGFVADYYLVALAIILIGALIAVGLAARVTGTSFRRFSPHFFVLGIAFLLLETRSLVSFSLLFGTTWLVNALRLLRRARAASSWPSSSTGSSRYADPTCSTRCCSSRSASRTWCRPRVCSSTRRELRYLLAVVLAFAPVFFANLVFSHSFRDTRTADMAFASNLLGAMVGGALEYLALITGYQALLLVVAAAVRPGLAVRHPLPAHGRPRPGAGAGAGVRVAATRWSRRQPRSADDAGHR